MQIVLPLSRIHNFSFTLRGAPGALRHDVHRERHDDLPVPLAAVGLLPARHIRRHLPEFRAGTHKFEAVAN